MKQEGVYYSTDHTLQLQCEFRGVRAGQVTWYHEDTQLADDGDDVTITSDTPEAGKKVSV